MGTRFRVDRADSIRTPVGMNALRYVGNSLRDANRTFDVLLPGFDAWDQPNRAYGVLLSEWDYAKRCYVARNFKECHDARHS